MITLKQVQGELKRTKEYCFANIQNLVKFMNNNVIFDTSRFYAMINGEFEPEIERLDYCFNLFDGKYICTCIHFVVDHTPSEACTKCSCKCFKEMTNIEYLALREKLSK